VRPRVEIVDYHQERDMAELVDEIHPGEILLEEFMKPMSIGSPACSTTPPTASATR